MTNGDTGNGNDGHSPTPPLSPEPEPAPQPSRTAGQEYYRRTLVARLEQARKEYTRLSRRLYHNGRVILETWVAQETEGVGQVEHEKVTLDELEIWEDLWIALWRKRRRLSRTIKALTREIADIDGSN